MKLLLIEHDTDYLRFLQNLLSQPLYWVKTATDGWQGLQILQQARYDMVVLEANLPDMSGYELVERLRQNGNATPVLMVSKQAEAVRGLYAGADDYVLRPIDPKELVARIYALHRRRVGIVNELGLLGMDALQVDVTEKVVYRASHRIQLTNREFQLLSFLMENNGRIVTKKQILENVWESDNTQNTNKVEVYINFLRRKIDQGFESKLIQTATGMGYLLRAALYS